LINQFKILIADDSKLEREILRDALLSWGYDVYEAVNGKEVIELFYEITPDLVIVDGIMPEMDGYAVCEYLQAREKEIKTPIILITAYDNKEAVERAFVAGAEEYLTKPIYWSVLKYRIKRILLARQAEIALGKREGELKLQNQYLLALNEVSLQLLNRLDLDDVLAMIVTYAVKLFQKASGSLYLLRENDSQVELKFAIGIEEDYIGFIQDKDQGIVGEVFAAAKTFIVQDYQKWEKRINSHNVDGEGVFIGLPLFSDKKVVGVIYIAINEPGWVCIEEQKFILERFIGLASIAYDNAILYKKAQEEIAERKIVEEKLRYISMHDSLTGLYNRTYFEEELNRISSGRFKSVGIVVCDVDGLKVINDTLGHAYGDSLIVTASTALKEACRRGDVIARIGGDEFVVLLPDADAKTIEEICQRIKDKVRKYGVVMEGKRLCLSIGWAVSNSCCGRDMQELFKEADAKMYLDKLLHKSI
jgi:diguanylate cyclase (GGDEF)-like protein